MRNKILSFTLFLCLATVAQNNDTFLSKFELSVNYGLAGNFFVNYDEDVVREDGNIVPLYSEVFDTFRLFQKNFIGTSGGFTVGYNFNTKNAITFSFDRNIHNGKYDGTFVLANGSPIFVRDIVLRHRNHFVSLTYRRSLNKKNNFYVHLGINYLRHNQAEINIAISSNFVEIRERNYDNANFEEGGFVVGLEKYLYKSGQFELGIQSKLFLLTSNPDLVETLTLVPILRFNF
mgnify:CR=1 FL=1